MMSTPYADNLKASKFAVQSYIVLVLAHQQKAPLGTLREIQEHRADAVSGLLLLQFGAALKIMGGATRSGETIALALKTPRNSDERIWLGDHSSPLRDSALMLSLLGENKLLLDKQYSLLNILLQQAFGERWLSTQESNTLFLAVRILQDLLGKRQAQTTFSAEPLAGEKAQTNNPNSDQLATLQMTNSGDQPLWLRAGVSGYP